MLYWHFYPCSTVNEGYLDDIWREHFKNDATLFVFLWIDNVNAGLNVIWTNELLLWTPQRSKFDVVFNEVSHCYSQLNV